MIGPENVELGLNKMDQALNNHCSVELETMKTTYNFALVEKFSSSYLITFLYNGEMSLPSLRNYCLKCWI